MSEIVSTYLLSDPDQVVPMEREEFYENQKEIFRKTGKPTRAVEIIDVLLFTPNGEVILQKRAKHKNHNPGLIDKSVGGHLIFGDSPTYTVMSETLQELSVPAFVLNSKDDFSRTYRLLGDYLQTSAVIQFVDSRIANFEKVFGTEKILIAKRYDFYLGVYGGSVRPADKEASGILFYDYDQLKEEMDKMPDIFTADLKFFLIKYEKNIDEFLKGISKVVR